MNDEPNHNTGHGATSLSPSLCHSSTHRQSLRLGKVPSGAQNEGLVFGATDAISRYHAASQETQSRPSEPDREPTRSAVSQDIEETVYSDDAEKITEKITEKIIDPASGEITIFEAALNARYERLSLLTLDLAEEAGESARCFSTIEPKRVTQGIASMTKAIWAHRVIEKLRTGKPVSTEGLAGLLPDMSNSPVKGPSTHSLAIDLNCIRNVAQNKGRGCDTKGAISLHHATPQKTSSPPPAPHPEPHPALSQVAGSACASKDSRQAECDESTEPKKEKNEIEQTAQTPQTRKTEANSNSIQPTGELCDLSATDTSEYPPSTTTHTDKMGLPLREAGRCAVEPPIGTDQTRSPHKKNACPLGDMPLKLSYQHSFCSQAIALMAHNNRPAYQTRPPVLVLAHGRDIQPHHQYRHIIKTADYADLPRSPP